MKAKVTMSLIWFNKGLRDFFFREQAYNTLEELVTKSVYGYQTIEKLNDATEDMDIDDVEEMFYSESVEYCADEFGIELEGEEDDEDE